LSDHAVKDSTIAIGGITAIGVDGGIFGFVARHFFQKFQHFGFVDLYSVEWKLLIEIMPAKVFTVRYGPIEMVGRYMQAQHFPYPPCLKAEMSDEFIF